MALVVTMATDEQDLVARVQDKVKAKWGAKPPEWKPKPGDTRMMDLRPGGDVSGEVGTPFERPVAREDLPVPRGLVVGIHQLGRVSGDFLDFVVVLEVNQTQFQARFRISAVTWATVREETRRVEMLFRQMVDTAVGAIMDSIVRGVRADLGKVVREMDWTSPGGIGVGPTFD